MFSREAQSVRVADTELKFGPEWMRTLCDRGKSQNQQLPVPFQSPSPTSQPNIPMTAPKYKSSEFRYGREEMLTLFDEKMQAPGCLIREYPNLAFRDPQRSLDLDDEYRPNARSANRDVVSRLIYKDRANSSTSRPGDTRTPARNSGGPPRAMATGARSAPRGFALRSFGEEEEIPQDRYSDFKRPEQFKRLTNDSERPLRASESEDGPKNRKAEFRGNAETNWRGRSSESDTSNWRDRQDGGSVGWSRDRASRWREDDDDLRNGPKSRFGYSREHWVNGEDDGLPEWSMDDDIGTSIGTFDASGAFMALPNEDTGGALEDDDGEEWTKVGPDRRKQKQEFQRNRDNQRNRNGLGHRSHHEDDRPYERHQGRSNRNEDSNMSERIVIQPRSVIEQHVPSPPKVVHQNLEDDGFASSIEQHAEHLVAKWTEEDDDADRRLEKRLPPKQEEVPENEFVYPKNHPDSSRWFYRDPQNAVQGPFTSHEMLGWMKEGYFQSDLLVRRGCDSQFAQLGQLMNLWGRNPFEEPEGSHSVYSQVNDTLKTNEQSNQIHQLLMRQQQQQQAQQKQLILQQKQLQMQNQLRQLLEHLKNQDGFSELTEQEQQQILIRRYAQQVDQMQTQIRSPQSSDVLRGLMSRQPQHVNNIEATLPSIWELTNGGVMTASDLEAMQRQEQEKREVEEMRIRENEHRRLEAEVAARRAAEEENQRKMIEIQRKMEEERKLNEERIRIEEERRRLVEEEERRRLAEEERRMMEEKKRLEEQRRRNEEIRRLNEEMTRKQQLEAEEQRRQKEEMFKLQEMERRRIKEQELERMRQHQQQQEALKRMREREPKGWGSTPTQVMPTSQLTLSEIQRIQEEKDHEERIKVQMQQQQAQVLYQLQMQSNSKSQVSWSHSVSKPSGHVKTLAEIQKEEADRLAKVKQEQESKDRELAALTNVGIWSNASSQLSWKNKAPVWGAPQESSNNRPSSGIWDEDASPPSMASNVRHQQTNTRASPTNKAKKEEEAVMKLFDQRKKEPTDEFTAWCEETLMKSQSSLDVPTFVAFLKGLESPFDVNDYIRSYLGENKESREFAKNFLEKRSFYRNQGRKKEDESMWGPAPAITPSVNKNPSNSQPQPSNTSTSAPLPSAANNNNNCDGDLNSKTAKSKKGKKGKRVLDTSLLGFTVQADPNRVNAGQIEHVD